MMNEEELDEQIAASLFEVLDLCSMASDLELRHAFGHLAGLLEVRFGAETAIDDLDITFTHADEEDDAVPQPKVAFRAARSGDEGI